MSNPTETPGPDPSEGPAEVVPLRPGGVVQAERAAAPASRPGRLHGLAIAGMASFAVLGTVALLAFITVTWPGDVGRVVVGIVIACVIGFMGCASAAVLSAARDTYARHQRDSDRPPS